jgi:hypothetical protein
MRDCLVVLNNNNIGSMCMIKNKARLATIFVAHLMILGVQCSSIQTVNEFFDRAAYRSILIGFATAGIVNVAADVGKKMGACAKNNDDGRWHPIRPTTIASGCVAAVAASRSSKISMKEGLTQGILGIVGGYSFCALKNLLLIGLDMLTTRPYSG